MNLFSNAKYLDRESTRGYGPLPIPQPRDEEISNLLKTWIALDKTAREDSAAQISDEQQRTFLAYSERMATLAVRERNQELLFLGLVALGLDGWRYDWRENMLIIPLHVDASQRIGADPEVIFEKAASLLSEEPAKGLRAFLRRSGRDKSLEAMGYIVGCDDDGFRYERTW